MSIKQGLTQKQKLAFEIQDKILELVYEMRQNNENTPTDSDLEGIIYALSLKIIDSVEKLEL